MTPAQRANYLQQIEDLGAPLEIQRAAQQVVAAVGTGRNVSDLVAYVRRWVNGNNTQNRYGK